MSCALRDDASIESAMRRTRLASPSAATIQVFRRITPPRMPRAYAIFALGRYPVAQAQLRPRAAAVTQLRRRAGAALISKSAVLSGLMKFSTMPASDAKTRVGCEGAD